MLAVVTKEDFDTLDGWLVKRLSEFFDDKLEFSKLKPVQEAIHSVLTKSEDIYEKGLNALNSSTNLNSQLRTPAVPPIRRCSMSGLTWSAGCAPRRAEGGAFR